jgi:hypothetical protein
VHLYTNLTFFSWGASVAISAFRSLCANSSRRGAQCVT